MFNIYSFKKGLFNGKMLSERKKTSKSYVELHISI